MEASNKRMNGVDSDKLSRAFDKIEDSLELIRQVGANHSLRVQRIFLEDMSRLSQVRTHLKDVLEYGIASDKECE